MKQQIFALFPSTDAADKAINELHQEVGIANDEISYIYRNDDGDIIEGDGGDVSGTTVSEGAATGAGVGALVGGAVGIAAAVGVAGPIGAVVAGGPLATALGISGAVGTTAAGAITGAAAGGLVGALVSLGLNEPAAKAYEDRVINGDVLVSVHTDKASEAVIALRERGATDIETVGARV